MIINPFLFFRMDVSGFRTYILKLELKFCFLSNIVVCNLDLLSPRRITAVSNWSHLFQIANLQKLTAEWEYKCYFKTILKWSHRQGNSKTKKEAVMLNLFASQIDTGSAGKKTYVWGIDQEARKPWQGLPIWSTWGGKSDLSRDPTMDKCQHCLFAAALASLFPVVFLVSDKQQSMIFHKPSTSAGTLNIKFANLQFLFGDCVKEIGLKVITEPSNSFYRQTIEMSEGERGAQSAQLYNGGRNKSNWQFQLAFASEKKSTYSKRM